MNSTIFHYFENFTQTVAFFAVFAIIQKAQSLKKHNLFRLGVTNMEKVILFQGDSITDCRRIRELSDNLGLGYPNLVSAELGFEGFGSERPVDVQSRI